MSAGATPIQRGCRNANRAQGDPVAHTPTPSRARLLTSLALLFILCYASLAQPQRLQLPNGVQLLVEQVPDAPLTAIEVWVRAGVADESPEISGVAHLLEHLVFKGTADLPPDALDEAFEQAGGVLDATTERDWTRYYATVLPDRWQTPLRILLRCLLQPALPAEALEKERRLILSDEYALHHADPIRPARYALFAKAFPSHPYGLPLLGNPETLARIDIETVRRFHQAHYRPEQLAIVLVGAVEAEAVQRVVEETINRARPSNAVHKRAEKQSAGEGMLVVLQDACLAIGVRTPPASDLDGWLCAEIVRIALAEPYRGLLYEGGVPPCFGRLHSEYLPRVQGSLLALYALPPVEPNEDWHAETRQRLERALYQIAQGEARPVLERARTVALLRHTTAMRHPSERARWYGLCTTLGLTLSPEEYAARLQSVPIEKVEAFARAAVESASSDALLSGDAYATNGGGQDTRRLGETLTQPTKALANTRTPRESSAAIARRTAVRQRLSNGLRVIALSAPDAESVLIQVAIAHPHAENAAVGELTARMLFGETRNETPYTLAMRIARSGGSLRVEWTPAGALITAFAQPDSVVNVLALLKESLFRAEFTEARLESARRHALYERQYYEGAQGWRLTAHLLAAYANEQALKGVSLRMVRAYYQAHYRPENTCLVIAGDFPTNRLVEFAHRLFGHEWETLSAPKPQEQAVRAEMRIGTVATPQGQAYTGYAWASSVASAKDYYALRALQVILAEGKQARLFRATRTQRGVGYAVQMEIALTRGGALGAGWVQTGSAPVPPDVLQAVLSEALHPEEWRRAQALLRGEWERLRMHLPAFTASLAWAELSGLGYEALWNAPAEIDTLSLEQVDALRSQLTRR